MAIIKMNNNLVKMGNKFATLTGGLHGLVMWDGFNDYVTFPAGVIVTGSKKMSFYININPSIPDVAALNADIFNFEISQNDIFKAGLYTTPGSCMLESITNTSSAYNDRATEVNSYKGQEIFVEIVKATNSIVSISINGTPQSLVSVQNVWSNFPRYQMGPRNFSGSSVPTYLLRDIKLYNDPAGANTLTHHWKGYPAGNTNAAWVDQVGSINGTVQGSPSITP